MPPVATLVRGANEGGSASLAQRLAARSRLPGGRCLEPARGSSGARTCGGAAADARAADVAADQPARAAVRGQIGHSGASEKLLVGCHRKRMAGW